jgi:hypothetical protein
MANIPTDATIRSLLDQVPPSCLQGSFDEVLAVMRKHGMQAFEQLGGRTLIAFDGTEFFCSQKLGCAHCQTRRRANGKTDFYHAMLAASIVAPGHAMVLPLMPEFITRQDGAEKQDCEREACKRWLLAHGARVKELRPIYLGDDLFACQPICAVSSDCLALLAFSAIRRAFEPPGCQGCRGGSFRAHDETNGRLAVRKRR